MDKDPSIEQQQVFYDNWNLGHRNCNFEAIPEEIRARGTRVVDIIRSLTLFSPRILEVGCGTGWLTERLCDIGQVTAIDLSPQAIGIARQRNITANLIAGDFCEKEFNGEVFDIIVCVETLFYVSHQIRFVKKLASLMSKDGFLVLTSINKFVYDRSTDVGPPEHGQIRKWLTKKQLKNLLSRHFEILSMKTIEPRGNMGILRLINSYKLNAVLQRLFLSESVKHMKEKIGLGGGIVVIAKVRSNN